ncbi:MAG TPA: biosynthetic peptidoglycan transglycosylase [Candidatus Dormibacteraeota bacterium]|nr:biosynthetic peptidoglycan transglycosylase [Candidatus Dormibacteraeota bacterium]
MLLTGPFVSIVAPLGRLAAALGVVIALFAPSAATLWSYSPDGSDIQARVASLTASYRVPLLAADDVPELLEDAIVAIEDERFFQHHGIDSLGLARAILYDVVNVCLCQGGSTITQQLVKDVYLDGTDRGHNKLVGMALALKVEGVISKRQIMADYLSEITTGLGRRGVTAAACAYYRAPISGLSLGQYALLAGVTQAPSIYDPTVNPDAARDRRAQVLAAMVADHYVTAAQASAADSEPVLDRGPGRPGC